MFKQEIDETQFIDKVVHINRVAKVVVEDNSSERVIPSALLRTSVEHSVLVVILVSFRSSVRNECEILNSLI